MENSVYTEYMSLLNSFFIKRQVWQTQLMLNEKDGSVWLEYFLLELFLSNVWFSQDSNVLEHGLMVGMFVCKKG